MDLDTEDIEYTMLKQRLFKKIKFGQVPSLVELTKIALATIEEDLEKLIKSTVDVKKCYYGVLTGVQIHGDNDTTFIWPSKMYCVINEKKHDLIKELA